MKVIDPGHSYLLNMLDGTGTVQLNFVKRQGDGYPGNVGWYSGTNLQEVLRALIDRVKYLDNQIPHENNNLILEDLRHALLMLEQRAAERHGLLLPEIIHPIEDYPPCEKCGHIHCKHKID